MLSDIYLDVVLICYNTSGIQKWNVSWDLEGFSIWSECVAVDSKDNIYVTGFTMNDDAEGYMFLRKYTNQSIFIWSETWTGPFGQAQGRDLFIDSKDNILVAISSAGLTIESKFRIFGYTPSGILITKMEWRSSDLGYEFLAIYCVSILVKSMFQV